MTMDRYRDYSKTQEIEGTKVMHGLVHKINQNLAERRALSWA